MPAIRASSLGDIVAGASDTLLAGERPPGTDFKFGFQSPKIVPTRRAARISGWSGGIFSANS